MTRYYQRDIREYQEEEAYGDALLEKFYGGRLSFLRPILTHPLTSEILTIRDRLPSRASQQKVAHFIHTYQIDSDELVEKEFKSFSKFFTRSIKPSQRPRAQVPAAYAVADAKLLVQDLSVDVHLTIKNQTYDLASLLQDEETAALFKGGTACIYRLGLEDIHHYLVAEAGTVEKSKKISGKLHTVREIAQSQHKIFKENKRTWTLLETTLGPVLQMEVGALLVGKIINKDQARFDRGQEKGYFTLGGSTILVLYPQGVLAVDDDIAEQSAQGIETQVKMGERIGYVQTTQHLL